MGRPKKQVTEENLIFVVEHLVYRMNAGDRVRGLFDTEHRKKRKSLGWHRIHPKSVLYRIAADAFDLGNPVYPSVEQWQEWHLRLERVLEQINAWVSMTTDKDQKKIWAALRQHRYRTGDQPPALHEPEGLLLNNLREYRKFLGKAMPNGAHCDPECPFLLPDPDTRNVAGRCRMLNRELEWHDFFLQECALCLKVAGSD